MPLPDCLENLDIITIIRTICLINPIQSTHSLKQKLFALQDSEAENLSDVQKAKYLYLKDHLQECIFLCNKLR